MSLICITRKVLVILGLITLVNCGGRIIHGKFFGTLDQNKLIDKLEARNVSESWITQPLDHFTFNETRTWSQRYLKSADYYKEGGPICIFVNGESAVSSVWLRMGMMVTHCSRLGAVIYSLEHRFFGKSQPLSDVSVGSLRYLTVQQTLADLASFIPYIKTKDNLGTETKTILFGGSYAASLVAYFMQQYPSLATVGVSSSGPLEWKYNFPEFHALSGKVIQLQSSTCHSTISSGIKELQAKLKAADCYYSTCPVNLSPLKVCGQLNVKNKQDIQTLYSSISSTFTYFVQYNGILKVGIKDLCSFIDSLPSTKTNYEKLAETINRMNYYMENECTFFSYAGFCGYINSQTWTSAAVSSGARGWVWLVCNEFASFLTTSSSGTYPFDMDVTTAFYAAQCQCAFGKQFTETAIQSAVQETQNNYGGLETLRNGVAYINGEYDPWSVIGVTDSTSFPQDSCLVLELSGGSHCNDLLQPRGSDSSSLLEIRGQIFAYIYNALVSKK